MVAGEFGFLGGSIGVATGERIARAFERAREQRLPLIALTASGGSRMQEGTLALVQMAKLATAAGSLRAMGLPYVVCLTDPTTGGVLASWGSLGTVTFALPEALLGFAGPRVVELTTGSPLPDGLQRAETLLADGLIDAVVEPGALLRAAVSRVLAVTAPAPRRRAGRAAPAAAPAPAGSASARRARRAAPALRPRPPPRPATPGRRCGMRAIRGGRGRRPCWTRSRAEVTELRGDRSGRPDDPGCLAALARLCGRPAMVVAQRRGADGRAPALGPAGYRKARRAFALAAELALPVVTIVDTPGAELSAAAEHGGLAGEIAGCLAELGALPVPTLALLLGEGGSGGALAFLHADRVVCAENASLAVIAPEGASAILHRDLDHAAELAATQGGARGSCWRRASPTASSPSRSPRTTSPTPSSPASARSSSTELTALTAVVTATRLAARTARWRNLGAPRP